MYRSFLSILFVVAVSAALSAQTQSGTTTKTHQKFATLTGCLSGPNDEGAYVLKNAAGHSVEVGGTDDLKAHVGHEVKLSGSWAHSGSEIGEREENESADKSASSSSSEKAEAGEHHEKRERHFKVSSVSMVSDTCSSGSKK